MLCESDWMCSEWDSGLECTHIYGIQIEIGVGVFESNTVIWWNSYFDWLKHNHVECFSYGVRASLSLLQPSLSLLHGWSKAKPICSNMTSAFNSNHILCACESLGFYGFCQKWQGNKTMNAKFNDASAFRCRMTPFLTMPFNTTVVFFNFIHDLFNVLGFQQHQIAFIHFRTCSHCFEFRNAFSTENESTLLWNLLLNGKAWRINLIKMLLNADMKPYIKNEHRHFNGWVFIDMRMKLQRE